MFKYLGVVCLLAGTLSGQTVINGSREIKGYLDLSNSVWYKPPISPEALSGACSPANIVRKVGLQWFTCYLGSWSPMSGAGDPDLSIYRTSATQLGAVCAPGACGIRTGNYTTTSSTFPSTINLTCPSSCTAGMTVFVGWDVTTSPATFVIGYDGSTGAVLAGGSGAIYRNTVTSWDNFDAQGGGDVYPLWTWSVTTPGAFDTSGGASARMIASFGRLLAGTCLSKTVANGVATLNVSAGCIGGGGGSSAFSDITSSTNTTATMTIGTGAAFTFSGSGTINANRFKGNTAVAVADGGTALTSATSGGVLFGLSGSAVAYSAALTASRLVLGGGAGAAPTVVGGLGTTAQVLIGNAAGAPSFGAVDVTTMLTGSVPTANGGTGQTTYAKGNILVATGAAAFAKLAVGADTFVLTADSGQASGVKWAAGGGGGGTPPGADTQCIFNDALAFGADAGCTFDKATGELVATKFRTNGAGSGVLTVGRSGGVAGVLALEGANSGTSTISPVDTVTGTFTLPAATDTLVGRISTDTLVNKTLTAPVMTTPTLGVASGTSFNKVAITAPATSATLTISDGKTLAATNSMTLSGTDSTVMTFPGTSATIARTDAANTFTGHQTIEGVATTGATGTGKLVFDGTPTLVTPVLGVATATSVNKVAFTAPASAATLTLANGSTLATSGANSITLTSTGSTNVTLPASGTLATTTDTITETHGGTNQTTWTKGDLLCASGANTLTKLTVGTVAGQRLVVDSTATCGFKYEAISPNGSADGSWYSPFGEYHAVNALTSSLANKVYMFYMQVTRPVKVGKISFRVQTGVASTNMAFAVYSDDATKVVESASAASTSTGGILSPALGATTTLQPGVYILAYAADNTTQAVSAIADSTGSTALLTQGPTNRFWTCANAATFGGGAIFPSACGAHSNYSSTGPPLVMFEN